MWNAVSQFDAKHRIKLASRGSLEFGTIDHTLFIMTFHSSTVRKKGTCFRCKSTDHFVGNCPFQEKRKEPTPRTTNQSRITRERRYVQVPERAMTRSPANEHPYAKFAEALCRSADATSVHLNPILNYESFRAGLRDHPDPIFKDYILNGIQNGISIGKNSTVQAIKT